MCAAAVTSTRPSQPQLFPSTNRCFYQVGGGHHPELIETLSEIFHRILTPLYGPQDGALAKIKASKDRKCFLLCEDEIAVGVIQFKTALSNEFATLGAGNSIEIKSLFVDHSIQNSGRGLGTALMNKLKEEVVALNLGHEGIHVTVSETKPESLAFFKKKGFEIVHAWKNRYTEGVTEYLLSCPAAIIERGHLRRNHSVTGPFGQQASAAGAREAEGGFSAKLIREIREAHHGDIHAIRKLSDGTFITGSKDNCIYQWDFEGEQVRVVAEVEPTQASDRDWITAIEILNDRYWLSANRNGKVILWKSNGDYVKQIHLKLPGKGHVSHTHNRRRVHCLAKGLTPDAPSFFVGFPTLFDEFNLIEGRTAASTLAHTNDWVYCIHPLSENQLLTVIGCTVSLWSLNEHQEWRHTEDLVQEPPKPRGARRRRYQRPFISSMIPLQSNPNHFGLAVFDGSVKVLDITTKQIVTQWREHSGRVWELENVNDHIFASVGEDCTIRFWNIDSPSSIFQIASRLGSVSTMKMYNETTLIVGTSHKSEPDQPLPEGVIQFYELEF